MPAPRIYRTEAIALKRTDLGEADRILTLYTPYLGKLRAVAKGVRRPTSKLAGHLEPMACSRLLLAKGRDLDIVTQGETVQAFPRIREDLYRTAYAFHLAEVVDNLTGERIENYPVYELLRQTLERLDTEEQPEMAVRFFEVQVLGHLGYRPELHRCLGCGNEARPVVNRFSAPAGGLLCPACAQKVGSGAEVSVNALKVLRILQSGDYALARRLHLSDELRGELEGLLRGYLQFVLERRLRSVEFLNTLRREGMG